jgi:hypothetical protein
VEEEPKEVKKVEMDLASLKARRLGRRVDIN